MNEIQIIIVGGGIVGLCIADAILEKSPAADIAILEKEPFLGDHTSGRNSGVIHAGIYYPHLSFKHKLCLDGNRRWTKFAESNHIPLNRCGKFIIANSEDQIIEVDQIYTHALKNGVPGIRWADNDEIKVLGKFTNAKKAIFSPTTAIVDVSSAIRVIARKVEMAGGIILKNTSVESISKLDNGFSLVINGERISSKIVINSAGLGAIDLRRKLGLNSLDDYYVKGRYLKTTQEYYKTALIYPVPEKDMKGLGVHTTFDFSGNLRFGPDTTEVNSIDYSMDDQIKCKFIPAIEATFKGIQKEMLGIDYAGIRPKIKCDGNIHVDFWIKGPADLGIDGYYELCGIESPGLTAAPAIGNMIGAEVVKNI